MNFLNNYNTTIVNGFQIPDSVFCSSRFKKSESKTIAAPTISPTQQAAETALGDFITPRIGSGATPYDGQLTADVPDLVNQSYERFAAQSGQGIPEASQVGLADLAAGKSFYDADPEQVVQDWRENFANPLTSYYNEFVRPEVREEFNVPGGFNTSERSEGVSRAFNEFYGRDVAPTLFQAQENERQREFAAQSQANNQQLGAIQFQQNLPSLQLGQDFRAAAGKQSFEQPELTARYNEFLRTALENDPYTQLGLGFFGQNTQDTIYQPRVGSTEKTLAMIGVGAEAGGSIASLAAAGV